MAKFDSVFKEAAAIKKADHPRRETRWIHYTKLVDHAAQYCNERDQEEIITLAGLIDADKEVLQNLLVRKIDADEYEIIAGHKRRRACKYLVEVEKKVQYGFLPCTVKHLTDVQAEFQLYSTNGFHEKSDYEKMHELERMKCLLETHPEEFPHLNTGRMVERLAGQLHMKKTTVGEYLTISKNLGEKGKEEFRLGLLKKSAAVELSSLPEKEQEQVLDKGIMTYKEIKSYKAEKEAEGKNHPPAVTKLGYGQEKQETKVQLGSAKQEGADEDPEQGPCRKGKGNQDREILLLTTQKDLDTVIHILDAYKKILQSKEGEWDMVEHIERIRKGFLKQSGTET